MGRDKKIRNVRSLMGPDADNHMGSTQGYRERVAGTPTKVFVFYRANFLKNGAARNWIWTIYNEMKLT